MNDAFGSRDPRPAADRRDEAAAGRDHLADQRDALSRLRDTAADSRDNVAQGRDTDARLHRGPLLARLRMLAERLTHPLVGEDGASTSSGDEAGTLQQGASGAVLLPPDEANAAVQLLQDTIALLESDHTLRAQAAHDRQDSARDRSSAAHDRRSAAHDRHDSSADRQQAVLDREQVDFRTDFQTLQRQLGAAVERTWASSNLVHQTLRSSREHVTETRRILSRLHTRAHPFSSRTRRPAEQENHDLR